MLLGIEGWSWGRVGALTLVAALLDLSHFVGEVGVGGVLRAVELGGCRCCWVFAGWRFGRVGALTLVAALLDLSHFVGEVGEFALVAVLVEVSRCVGEEGGGGGEWLWGVGWGDDGARCG